MGANLPFPGQIGPPPSIAAGMWAPESFLSRIGISLSPKCLITHQPTIVEENENRHMSRIPAGRRTYFLDLKQSRNRDYYIVITESRRKVIDNNIIPEKTRIFLYPEDVNRFQDALQKLITKMKELMPRYDFEQYAGELE